jgi:phosphoenolpyruvate carboxykinase (ATP)
MAISLSSNHLPFHGLVEDPAKSTKNSTAETLLAIAERKGEGSIASNGAFAAFTGEHTGRSPKDKFIFVDDETRVNVAWGEINQAMQPEVFDRLAERFLVYLKNKELFVEDLRAGADTTYQLKVRLISEFAWHALFAKQLFIRPENHDFHNLSPDFTVVVAPGFQADPLVDKVCSKAVIAINFKTGLILIGGTRYAGEIKKSIFTVLNYLLPQRGVLPMHCSANRGVNGETALFFGLSGTGKTTLSADPDRHLIGDDEHGWSDAGIFNFEGGCYAKCIHLSKEREPQIWSAIRRGAVLENVVLDKESKVPDYDDDSITENTRAAYPLDFIDNAVLPSVGGHPKNIFFLTADAFGVLPPIARLNAGQAMYHFLSGYTSKIAGTESGLGKEPQSTFSSCFGAPFLPLRPSQYAEMLGRRIREHQCECWLVNTGWIGGRYGVGERISLSYTRALIKAALSGLATRSKFETERIFRLSIPKDCPDVPSKILHPRQNWSDKRAYDRTAVALATRFRENAEAVGIPRTFWEGGPVIGFGS